LGYNCRFLSGQQVKWLLLAEFNAKGGMPVWFALGDIKQAIFELSDAFPAGTATLLQQPLQQIGHFSDELRVELLTTGRVFFRYLEIPGFRDVVQLVPSGLSRDDRLAAWENLGSEMAAYGGDAPTEILEVIKKLDAKEIALVPELSQLLHGMQNSDAEDFANILAEALRSVDESRSLVELIKSLHRRIEQALAQSPDTTSPTDPPSAALGAALVEGKPAEPQDGPGRVREFHWRGVVVGMEPQPWHLVKYLWGCKEHRAEIRAVADGAWGDPNVLDGTIAAAASRATKAFTEAEVPLSVSVKSGAVALVGGD
jgi:hypothetical protein